MCRRVRGGQSQNFPTKSYHRGCTMAMSLIADRKRFVCRITDLSWGSVPIEVVARAGTPSFACGIDGVQQPCTLHGAVPVLFALDCRLGMHLLSCWANNAHFMVLVFCKGPNGT
jgi:hypothetical protein